MLARIAMFSAALAVAGVAHAASFNCAKATTPDEIAICDSRALSEADVKMATLYGVRMGLPMLMGNRGAAQDEQRAFLETRGACGNEIVCLNAAYDQRIGELQQAIETALQDYCVKLGICG